MKRRFSARELAVACIALPLLFGAQGGGCGKSKSADGGTGKPECPSSASCVQIDAGGVPPGSSAGASGGTGHATGGAQASSTGGTRAATGGSSGSSTGGTHAATGGNSGSSTGGTHADAGSSANAGHDATDAGNACVSKQGEHCGGNILHPCTCASGLTCTPAAGGPPPGDVGGTCQPSASAGACTSASDCHLEADYCTGCDCRALAAGEHVPACTGPGVQCLIDPCSTKSAACDNHVCVAH